MHCKESERLIFIFRHAATRLIIMQNEEDEFENDRLNKDVSALTSWWIQEEASPEILDFQTQLVQDIYSMVSDKWYSKSEFCY